MKALFILVLFASCASAKDLYQIHPLSEKEVQQTYIQLLHDACLYADRDWTNSSFDPRAGYWGAGRSGENSGIRTIGSMVLGCGTLLKYDDSLSDAERQDLLSKATAAIRYATATHFTGSHRCTDGRKWGGMDRPGVKTGRVQWESSYWTGSLAMGAWLIWDKLDPQLRRDIERVVAAQDNFLATSNPPVNLWADTKAEENGWNVPLLCMGELMFPSNPQAALWHKTAIKYMMNTLCTAADTNDTSLVDGREVKDWVLGANLQPDFTLENHNVFHPSYVACSSYFLTQAALCYTYANQPVPQAATHHLMDIWRMHRTVILPWGEVAYPQGMDWELHGLPYINLYAAHATRWKDPFAAHMEQDTLEYMRAWQLMCDGSLTLTGSPAGISRHAINIEQAAYGFLAHKLFGPSVRPMTARAANTQEEGVWDYPYVDFIEQRTLQKFVSFSWKNRIMGMVIPIQDHEDNPEFTVPIANGIIGSFQAAGGDSKPVVVEHSRKMMPDGFQTSGTLLINGGRLKQTLQIYSIGNQTVVYEDRVTALTNITVQGEFGVPLGIQNDWMTGGTRLVSDQDGQIKFDWEKPQEGPVVIPGSWANVSGKLGVVTLSGAGMAYAQASGYSRGISVYTDILYGSYSDEPRQFKTGDEVAHRTEIVFAEVSPRETSKLAKSCRIESTPGGQELHFKQPDGTPGEVPLF